MNEHARHDISLCVCLCVLIYPEVRLSVVYMSVFACLGPGGCLCTCESLLCAAVLQGPVAHSSETEMWQWWLLSPGPQLGGLRHTHAADLHCHHCSEHTHRRSHTQRHLWRAVHSHVFMHVVETHVLDTWAHTHTHNLLIFHLHTALFSSVLPSSQWVRAYQAGRNDSPPVWVSCFLHPALSPRPTLYTHTSLSSSLTPSP